MKPFSPLQLAMWWLSFVLQVAIALGMFRRRLSREMPVFLGYTIFHLIQFVAEMVAYKTSYAVYFYVYWTTEVFDALITFLVIQEIFSIVFRPYEALRRAGVLLFRCTLLLLVGIAIVTAIGGSSNPGITARVHALNAIQRGTLFVQAGMFITLIIFSRAFGLTWRNYVFGISLGFGVMACVSGIPAALVTHVPPPYFDWFRAATGYGFFLAILVWVYYIVAPSSSVRVDNSQIDASPLKDWNRALEGLINRKT
jgi:hypothetical protein